MKVPPHIAGLYNRSIRRYKKIIGRLKAGKYSSTYQYEVMLLQLQKLKRKIAALRFQLRIAAASGALIFALGTIPAEAQTTNGPFTVQPRHVNPLREPIKFEGTTYPATVDLDKDGDLDLLVGDEGDYDYYNGTIKPLRYLLNIGTDANPVFEEKYGDENPFNSLTVLSRVRGPVFADIDEDGDEDLFVGIDPIDGPGIEYFRNDGGVFTAASGSWDPVTKTGNPFSDLSLSDNVKLSFTDLDNDGDLDAIISGTGYDVYTGSTVHLHYYRNDGAGTFTSANNELTLSPVPTDWDLAPAIADIDEDGDVDLVLGGYYLGLRYYRQVSAGNFVEETGVWDPVLKTGNPFDEIYEPNTQPIFADIDNDGDTDLLLGDGDGDHFYAYPNNIIHYFQNTGSAVFQGRPQLENPLSGIEVDANASPVLMDLDGDDDLDALIGKKYENSFFSYNTPEYFSQDDGVFQLKTDGSSPFSQMTVLGPFTPAVVDLDADGDLDVVSGNYYGQLHFFRNDNGVYTEEVAANPFTGIDFPYRTNPELADMDGDGDADLILGNYSTQIRYFENTGTPQVPQFEERLDLENPFAVIGAAGTFAGYLDIADVDHDGDLDVLTSHLTYLNYYGFNTIAYYENSGTAEQALFNTPEAQPFGQLPTANGDYPRRYLQPFMSDIDLDGDLDLFIGDNWGYISYVRNENPLVTATASKTEINYRLGADGSVPLDPGLVLTDGDKDLMVQATVAITDFQEGEILTFTPQFNIAGVFSNGLLTLRGKGTLAEYQAVLRTVAYNNTGSAGRKRPLAKSVVSKSLEFRVFDSDFTHPIAATIALNVITNTPPAMADATETTQLGRTVTIDLTQLVSDPDDNIDLTSLAIVQQPSSGAVATIDDNHTLVIDYNGVNFTGADNLIMEVCDDLGDCVRNVITIQVENISANIVIFNAVAPNSTGDNHFMRIFNLPRGNKVTIYNRWGDKVFGVGEYDNDVPGKRFEGAGDNGKSLPAGTYFYRIEVPEESNLGGPELLTGYITLKQ